MFLNLWIYHIHNPSWFRYSVTKVQYIHAAAVQYIHYCVFSFPDLVVRDSCLFVANHQRFFFSVAMKTDFLFTCYCNICLIVSLLRLDLLMYQFEDNHVAMVVWFQFGSWMIIGLSILYNNIRSLVLYRILHWFQIWISLISGFRSCIR